MCFERRKEAKDVLLFIYRDPSGSKHPAEIFFVVAVVSGITLGPCPLIAQAANMGSESQPPSLDVYNNELSRIYTQLSRSDRQRLIAGETLVFARDRSQANTDSLSGSKLSSSDLPEVFVYKVAAATSEEVAAIMTDYERHKSYFQSGKMKRSTVIQKYSSLDMLVSYRIRIIPLILYEDYVLRSRLFRTSTGYRMDRTLVKGKHVRAIEGVVRAAPLDGHDDRAVVMYYGFVDPGLSVSRQDAIETIQNIVEELEQQVQLEKKSDLSLLASQVQILRDNLQNGEQSGVGHSLKDMK